MNASSAAPTRKVAASTLAGAATTVLLWFASAYGHLSVPSQVSSALVVLASSLVAYMTPSVRSDYAPPTTLDAKGPTPVTLIQDFQLGELIFGDLATFAAGSPVSSPVTIGGTVVDVTVQSFGATQPPAPFIVFGGSLVTLLFTILTTGSEIAAGQSVSVAEKIGNTWYGTTLKIAPKA